MSNDEKIKKWLAGELSDAERKEFEATGEFAELSRLLEAVKHFKAPSYDVQSEYSRLSKHRGFSVEEQFSEDRKRAENRRRHANRQRDANRQRAESWQHTEDWFHAGDSGHSETSGTSAGRSGLQNAADKKKTVSLDDRLRQVFKVAAILVIALTAGYFTYQQVLPFFGSRGWITEQSEIFLPDSSFVSLNTASGIRFAEKNWDKERIVELKGEAFFSVRKGVQFTVETPQGRVSVLGTEFNVKDRDDYFQVTCFNGSVKVTTPHRTVVLQPQSSYRMVQGREENFIYSGESEPDWFRGESSFRSVPLNVVIEELERQYHVIVETKDVDVNQLFTGSFSHKNLEIALKAITIPVNLHYEINENKIVITLEGK